MAWGATFDVPGADSESYDQIVPLLEEVTQGLPEGCIVHMSPTKGGYRVPEVWESEEHWKHLRTEILTPLLQRITGEETPDQPDPQPFPIHSIRARSTE